MRKRIVAALGIGLGGLLLLAGAAIEHQMLPNQFGLSSRRALFSCWSVCRPRAMRSAFSRRR